ncbi:bifunctional DNA primase/polymerase [Aurantimonas sp. HBX-1]|uniref:bifunctional DNA primase/polymerase n=1 Tax=Aurantimonas sp. HBX-1 TaxID=2906072 RepID=UPI001F21C94B|nr:bifunctional DNA primase/polymerase [Aurantimonas sp. HBX-1]UIJ71919.1 bifunctional DNA primase/polymerase [Aurantimonas sp. HBX-1]
MSRNVFAETAPKLWSRGLRCVPIEDGSKRPAKEIKRWQGYLGAAPSQQTVDSWLERYPTNGIGLLLGSEVSPGKILVALDVDDDRLVEPVERLIGRAGAISGKVGKKGATYFVLMPKGGLSRSTTLFGAADLNNIDVLAGGRQTVMPPSVHPETNEQYQYLGAPLVDVAFADLPYVTPEALAVLGVAVGSDEILTLLEGKSTHDAGLALAGRLVAKGAEDDEIRAIFESFLPEDYAGDSLEHLPGWISSAREKGFGDGAAKRETATAALVSLGSGNGVELFNDGHGSAYATVPTEQGRETVRLPSDSFKMWLRHRAHRAFEKPLASSGPLLEAMATLEAMALYEGSAHVVSIRTGGDERQVEIDLGRPDGKVVVIKAEGWGVREEGDWKLVRGAGFGALPDPAAGDGLARLQSLLNLTDASFQLTTAFLLNALKPNGPFFILLIEGEQGSGKSLFAQLIKRIIDPNAAERIRLPDNDRDLMVQAKEFRLLNFDNASGMKADISDALCSLATGGGVAVRKLYTDGELNVLSFARPFMINGISSFANRPDLMERAIPIQLPPMPTGVRREEAAILREFEDMLPSILGTLYSGVSSALRHLPDVEAPTTLRMADAARWIKAAAMSPEIGVGGGELIAAIEKAQTDFFIERINDDPILMRLREITAEKPFEGYVGDLFARFVDAPGAGLPRTPAHLSKALDRLRPAMAKAGVWVEFREKDRRGRLVRITSEAKGPPPKPPF